MPAIHAGMTDLVLIDGDALRNFDQVIDFMTLDKMRIAVDDIIMPPIGLVMGNVDFSNLYLVFKEGASSGPYAALAEAKKAGAVTVNYGLFANSVISFLIVAFAVFLLVRLVNKMKRQEAMTEPTSRECPYCASTISSKAKRCPHCTSELG